MIDDKEIMLHFLRPLAIVTFVCVIIVSQGAYLLIQIDSDGTENVSQNNRKPSSDRVIGYRNFNRKPVFGYRNFGSSFKKLR